MNLPTIRISPSELPKFNFLQYRNYLGEFKTEIDKARVRYNLGIPDSLSFKWGNIGGTIENQLDLIQLVRLSVNNQYNPLAGTVETLTNKITTLGESILTLNNEKNNIQILNNEYKQSLEQRLLEIEREISLNAALIKLIDTDGAVVDLVPINNQLNDLIRRVTSLEANSQPTDLSAITSQLQTQSNSISQLQNLVTTLLNEVTRLQGLIGITTLQSISVSRNEIEATTASDKANIIVTATFSTGNTRDITSECNVESSNTNVATWNNGIQFIGVGTAIITYTYTYEGVTKTATTNVSVSAEGEHGNIPTQYVGYAVDPSYVLGVPRFGTSTIAKTWTPENTAIEQAPVMGFWVCTTQNIATFSGSVGEYNLLDLYVEQRTYNGITYKIYMAGPVSEATTFNITI